MFSQVSTAEQCRSSPKSMISCNKKSLYLPQEMSAIYIEFTEYYYPDGKDFPSKRVYLAIVCSLLGEYFGFYQFMQENLLLSLCLGHTLYTKFIHIVNSYSYVLFPPYCTIFDGRNLVAFVTDFICFFLAFLCLLPIC